MVREICLSHLRNLRAQRSREACNTYRQPDDLVRVCGVSSATGVLLVTSALDNDGIVKGS
jgi:hypothetical protein